MVGRTLRSGRNRPLARSNAVKLRASASAVEPPGEHGLGRGELCVTIHSHADILEARQRGRELAARLGFSSTACTLVAAAISELARNIVLYAKDGEICVASRANAKSIGVVIRASDNGPGISDLGRVMRDGFSTSRGLGLGLPGVKRIMDEFDIVSNPQIGTTVTATKWRPR